MNENAVLTKAAREAVSLALENKQYDYKTLENRFPKKAGLFVEIYKNNELRGSVGFVEPVHPIGKAVAMVAKAAAFEDPRFPKLKKEDLGKIKFKVFILTLPKESKIGRKELAKKLKGGTGIIIRFGPNEGVLLPHETTGLSGENMLEEACQKAGLAPETWMDKNAAIYTFSETEYSE